MRDAITPELADRLTALVDIGEPDDQVRALMNVTNECLAFYTVGQADQGKVPPVFRVEVRPPERARVTVVRQPAQPNSASPATFDTQTE